MTCITQVKRVDRVNAWLVRALVGTTWLCVVVSEIITILCPIMLNCAGTNG